MVSRRDFLARSSALVSLAPFAPSMLSLAAAAPAEKDAKALVVIQLDGGNDGLNTVVPFEDDEYAKARKTLKQDPKFLHNLGENAGLHSRMKGAKELFDDGRLTVIQAVGYPNPNRSHFTSMRIWQTARFEESAHDEYGWLGRALDGAQQAQPGGEGAFYVGEEQTPVALWGRRSSAVSLSRVEDLSLEDSVPTGVAGSGAKRMALTSATPFETIHPFVKRQVDSAFASAEQLRASGAAQAAADVPYPANRLGQRLKLIAQLLKSGSPARVYYTAQDGYDTHSAQVYTHAALVQEFSEGLKAFLDDLRAASLEDRVVVLAFSEFGRRVHENASLGTDHGTAGPVFIAGRPSIGGLIGKPPNLSDLADGDIKTQFDFRRVYTSLLQEWLNLDSPGVLGAKPFDPLPILRA